MIIGGRRASFLLFAGDIATFTVSLVLALWLRYGVVPTRPELAPYLAPFSFLFALWILVFYMAGLYGKRLALFPSRVPDALLATQLFNILLAALFFFLIPVFGIAPKTILVVYLLVSLALIYFWRLVLYPRLSTIPHPERAALVAAGPEAEALAAEVNGNSRYGIVFCCQPLGKSLETPEAFLREIEEAGAATLVVDTAYPEAERVLPLVYTLTRVERRFQFAAFDDIYEEVFDRVRLSQLAHAWFLENVISSGSPFSATAKRLIDIVGGVLMGLVTVVVAPGILIANRIEGPGPLFVRQERLGERGGRIRTFKFRSMLVSDGGMWPGEGENRVTRVGSFLRKTSLDEFPQFLNVLRGELSLIGPRNDLVALGERLAEAIPYYDARYLVKPGITGWAQINQQYEPGNLSPQSLAETRTRLAYDFYYLKHRSLGLDIVIALKTVKRMFFRLSSW